MYNKFNLNNPIEITDILKNVWNLVDVDNSIQQQNKLKKQIDDIG